MGQRLATYLLALGILGHFAPPTGAQITSEALVVDVRIVDGVARTVLRQTLRNQSLTPDEAVWILPLPEGAAADHFRVTVGGTELEGDVLDADEARRVYTSIVRRRRDPGLLEYFGRGLLRARVAPIPPRTAGKDGEVVVEVGFRHVLPRLDGLRRWALALSGVGIDGRPPAEVTLDVTLESVTPVSNVFFSSAAIDVVRRGPGRFRASFEGRRADLGERELTLDYGLTEQGIGLDLLTYQPPPRGDHVEDGTFLLMISPSTAAKAPRLLKEITFVLDTSGSMAGKKIAQARAALRQFLASLATHEDPAKADRFNVVTFSTEARPFYDAARPATPDAVEDARERVAAITTRGGTNVDAALEAGLGGTASDADGVHRIPILVFLTDGQPTLGIADPDVLLRLARERNQGGARVFVLGVGTDVNTRLLDGLAHEGRGARDYVLVNESIERKASSLFRKLSHPVLQDLALELEGIELYAMVPSRLPDLFDGDELRLFGRYRGSGRTRVTLRGTMGTGEHTYSYVATFQNPEGTPLHASLPSLWAERRVAQLLAGIQRNGRDPELIDEVRRLGIEHGIVTPYTAHLLLEENARQGWRTGGGGAGSSPSGPTAPGPGAPGRGTYRGPGDTARDGFFLGRGQRAQGATEVPDVQEWLRAIGVLPEDVDDEEASRLAASIAQELQSSAEKLERLGRESTGRDAVETSAYFARLLQDGQARGLRRSQWLDLFTRRIGSKVFQMRHGTWTDRAFDPEAFPERRRVEAFSDAHLALIDLHPELGAFSALSTRMIVVLDGAAIEVFDGGR